MAGQASYEEQIVSVVGTNPEQELDRLLVKMDLVSAKIVGINTLLKNVGKGAGLADAVSGSAKVSGARPQADEALDEQRKIKAKMLAEERELNRLIKEEEKKKRDQQLKDERELTRLIQKEQQERIKAERDAIRASNKAKLDSDKEYIANYKRLLKEKDDADKKSAKAAAENAAKAQKAAVNQIDPGSLKAMSARLEELRNGYQKLTQAERDNAEIGGVVLNRVKELDAALKAADATQGKYQRNVGNYSSAFNGLGFSIRNIAGELPNLGISIRTFTQSLSNNIGPLTEAIANARQENARLAADGQRTVPIGRQIASSIFNWQTAILALVAAFVAFQPQIEDFVKGLFSTKKAVDGVKASTEAYNKALQSDEIKGAISEYEQMEETISLAKKGFIDSSQALNIYNESLGKTFGEAKNLNEAEAALIKNKEAYIAMIRDKTIATTFYGEAASKLVESQLLSARIAQKDFDLADELKDVASVFAKTGMTFGATGENSAQKRADQLKKDADILNKAGDDWQQKAADISKKFNFDMLGGDGKDKDKPGKTDADGTSARLAAIKQANDLAIAEKEREFEHIAYVNKKIADDEDRTLDERLAAYKEYEAAKKGLAFLTNTKEGDDLQATLDALTDKEEQHHAGKLKMTAYQLETLRIQKENANAELQQLYRKGEDAFTLISEQGAMDRIMIAKNEADQALRILQSFNPKAGPSQSREQYDVEQAKIRLQAAQDAVRVEMELLSIVSDANRQKINDLDNEIAKVKELEDVRRKEILASGLTEKEQKEALAALEAKTANDLFQLNEKKRQAQIKQARFDKMANIGLLIQETAIAVVRALGSKPFTPANIGLAIGVGAIGAANISRAALTPIPTYFDGTGPDGHPSDSHAIVGDGGRPEVIRRADGSIEITPSRPTLTYLKKGEVVHKSIQDYIDKAQGLTMRGMGVMRRVDERNHISTKEMERQLKRVANGIDRLAGKEPVNIQYIGRDWDSYIADIFH